AVEASCRRSWRFDAVLIRAKGSELRSDHIRSLVNVDAQSRIGEIPVSMHLRDCHVRVPVRDRAFSRVGLVSDPSKTVSWRKNEWCTLAVDVEAGVVLARAPGIVDGFLCRGDCGREVDYCREVQVTVRLAV